MLDQILGNPAPWTRSEPRPKPTFHVNGIPRTVRFVNGFMRGLNGRGHAWLALSHESLMTAAESRTGLADWGEDGEKDDFLETLAVLVDSLESEGRLTPFGRIAVRQDLIKHLSNRLLVIDVLKRFPEIRQVELEEPIFILGWYRTGTTLLHHLLATSPHLRAPLFWELRNPCPPGLSRPDESRAAIRQVWWTNQIRRYLTPHFDIAHPIVTDQPEECLHLFENTGVSVTSFFISEAKSFAWWLVGQDLRPAYRFFRSQLQVLQWLRPFQQCQGRRWVLKWPYHFWHLDALMDVFPDARVVQTHRDPLKAVPSVCSLSAIARSPMCEEIDGPALGRFWLDYFATGLDRGLAAREGIAASRIVDVYNTELIHDPMAAVARVHERFDLPFDTETERRARAHLDANPRHKNGIHRYGLDQFGLEADEVRERYLSYHDRFSPQPEGEGQARPRR